MDRWTLWQTCAAQAWSPKWGDADLVGVGLTFLYDSAALLTCYSAIHVWLYGSRQSSCWFWTLASAYLVLLAINKQLDLQTFLTQTGRCIARA